MIVVKYKPGVETNDTVDTYFNEDFFEVVNEGICEYFDPADIIVTSALDGKHSENSLHYKGHAIDLRIRHLKTITLKYTVGTDPWAYALHHAYALIAEQLEDYCFIVHAKDGKLHSHCQYGRKNIIGKGIGEHKNLYLK